MKQTRHLFFSLALIAGALGYSHRADAQTNTVVATPSSLSFYTQTGVSTAPQTVLLSTASGSATISVSAVSDTNWLTVTSSASTTPAVLTVSIAAGAPTSGVDVGFVNVVSSGSSTLSIPVTLNANSNGAPSAITASQNSLSFVFPNGSTSSESQTISLSSSNPSVTNFTAKAIVNSSGTPWLSVTPTAGTLPGNLQVTVNPVTLLTTPGTFDAAVAINAPGTNGISIPVLVTVQGTPTLTVAPAQLSFGYQLGASAPAAQTLTLSSSTGANVSFTANAQTNNCGNWIVLNQNSGATPSTLSVLVNTSGLTAGNCTGTINISAPGAINSSISVPVAMLVSSLPLIQAPSSGPTFTYQIGAATPAALSIPITSSTSGLSVTASATPDNNGPNFLQINTATGTTPESLMLNLNPTVLATLGPGTYTETVSLTASGAGNSPQTFDVTLTVSSNPTLTTSVQSLNFNYQVGQTAPSNQTFTVTSSGAPLNYQVAVNTTSCPGFLSATPSTGSTFSTQNLNQVVVTVTPQGISPQVCNGSVTLTVPGSTAAPLVIPVTLNVSNTALLNVSQAAINVTAIAGASATTQTVSVTSTNNTGLAFSATASTSPAGLTWLSVTPNSGSTPSNLQVTINPANLGVGVYTGSVVVSSPAGIIPAQTIPVTLTVYSSTATTSQPSLTFSQALGGSAPETQSIQIAGVPSGTTIGAIATALSGSGWLTATASGNSVTVAANGSQLLQGTYSGIVTVIIPGAAGSPLYVPVTLDVTAATSAITLSATTASFNVLAGSNSVPTAQTVQVTSTTTGSNAQFTASFVPSSGGNFITVSPSSGTTPATLTLSINSAVASTLAAGTYTGQVQVSSGSGAVQNLNVSLIVSAAGTPVVLAVTSAASLQPGAVSPGEIVSIFGDGIGPASTATFTPMNNTVATSLGNVTVTFNKVPAPLLFVSQGQINAIVPYEVSGQTSVPVTVQLNGTTSANFTVPITATTPSIFSLTYNGSGQGAILNADSTVNGTNNPAAPGSIIQIFATGEGQLTPAGTTGCISGSTQPLPKPTGAVSLTIGGQAVTNITYAAEAPEAVCGLLQIDATIPSNVSAGAQPVTLTIGTATNTNQSITVAVK